jgi:hypothetical protein
MLNLFFVISRQEFAALLTEQAQLDWIKTLRER